MIHMALMLLIQTKQPPQNSEQLSISGSINYISQTSPVNTFSFGTLKTDGCPAAFQKDNDGCKLTIRFESTPFVTCTPLKPVMDDDQIVRQEMTCFVPAGQEK